MPLTLTLINNGDSGLVARNKINAGLTAVNTGAGMANSKYEAVAASQTGQVLGTTGAIGDYLASILVVPATTDAGAVSIQDGTNAAITIFAGGSASLDDLTPLTINIGLPSASGAWQVTGANVSVLAAGNFT